MRPVVPVIIAGKLGVGEALVVPEVEVGLCASSVTKTFTGAGTGS